MSVKRKTFVLISFLILACSSEDANDCFQTSGKIIKTEIQVASFETILVNRDIELIINQAETIHVSIETGENLLNEIEVYVRNNQLVLSNKNSCNYVRDYGLTKITVSAPNISQIRSSTQYEISSQGILDFNTLLLISEDYGAPGTFTVGDFRMEVNCNTLNIVTNSIASFDISGYTESLFINFAAGAGRFEGERLIAQHVNIFHRGNNDIIVNPQQSISGELRSTGDVLVSNPPPRVSVQEFYTGRLIFEN